MPSNAALTCTSPDVHYITTSKVLGKGSYAQVKVAEEVGTNKRVAAKETNLRYNQDSFDREVRILSSLSHDNIVTFYKAEENKRLRTGTIFMDLLSGPSLYDYFVEQKRSCGDTVILSILLKLVDAVSYLHSQGFAHRDLKPENICFKAGTEDPVLFDFGLSYIGELDRGNLKYVGSPLYMAPEVLLEKGYDPFSIDVWGLGLILFAMTHHTIPNDHIRDLDVLQETISNLKNFQFSASAPICKILAGMLSFDPGQRWSLERTREEITAIL